MSGVELQLARRGGEMKQVRKEGKQCRVAKRDRWGEARRKEEREGKQSLLMVT